MYRYLPPIIHIVEMVNSMLMVLIFLDDVFKTPPIIHIVEMMNISLGATRM